MTRYDSSPLRCISEVLRAKGWTCEYHEPVNGPGECADCDSLHLLTAQAIVRAMEGQT